MIAIRFILLKISILICFSSFGQINDTWDSVKVGTTDIEAIKVGENLVWCKYGDISGYTETYFYYSSTLTGRFTTIAKAKQFLDCDRDPNCDPGSFSARRGAAYNTLSVGSLILIVNDGNVECWLDESNPTEYEIIDMSFQFLEGQTQIIKRENGVITYSENY